MSWEYAKVELNPPGAKAIPPDHAGDIIFFWQDETGMQGTTYDCPQGVDFDDFTMRTFNSLGMEGWELAGIRPDYELGIDICWLKRAL